MNERADSTAESRFVVTSNRGFAAYAQDELRALTQGTKFDELIPAETYLMRIPLGRDEAIRTIAGKEPIFLRHMHPIDATVSLARTIDDIRLICAAAEKLHETANCDKIAIQIRKAEGFTSAFEPSELREAIAELWLEKFRAETVVKDAERIISVFLTSDCAYIGISAPGDNLSDWPGGAVRFRKEEGQVSRAKFKLLEAEYAFGLDFSKVAKALDIGSAPGGWTSLLLDRGAEVTAVDPAELHPDLLRHPKLTYLKRNAGEVAFRSDTYDLLVCDMSWSPKQMVKLILPLLDSLRPGGIAIITLKLMHGKPFQTVKDSVRAMQPTMQLRKAKQLFHNRDELTVYLQKIN
ncbi:methyltransferase domain-containing protein [Paenibacillus hemerocallicola]|uniref:Methyltransferase domain-containing protein n=1 Tax=Paenibacillus hemerocallicola TaxID=1172614 RepID=A0A5C4TIB1_9BACL|nr:SAM-dependent methyltransferase [Paenibacillus hemerocallicola]TNJ68169.1 methyltransferase domain-containing protein [Paenibacillus hemerocallicola]